MESGGRRTEDGGKRIEVVLFAFAPQLVDEYPS